MPQLAFNDTVLVSQMSSSHHFFQHVAREQTLANFKGQDCSFSLCSDLIYIKAQECSIVQEAYSFVAGYVIVYLLTGSNSFRYDLA